MPSRAHEQDRANDNKAQEAGGEGKRGGIVASQQWKGGKGGLEAGEFVASAGRGAGALARQQRCASEKCSADFAVASGGGRARTPFVLRMSPKALHGDPERVRHSRLPLAAFAGVGRLPACASVGGVPHSAERCANQATLTPTRIAPEVGQIQH